MRVYYPPQFSDWGTTPRVFLAGTIDMGNSHDWQSDVIRALEGEALRIFNPRREFWNNPTPEMMQEQVEWELEHIEVVDHVVMNFAPDSQSPITLLELGLIAGSDPDKLIVCCPPVFWRYDNVRITCERYGIEMVHDVQSMIELLKERLV
jgi:hypothetical protein